MARRKAAPKRKPLPDPKYKNTKVAKFMNQIMLDGKKSIAEGILYGAFNIIEEKTKKPPFEIFEAALEGVAPVVEVKSRRVGGSIYQVPLEIRPERGITLAIRWLLQGAKTRKSTSFQESLAQEIIDASQSIGYAIKKKEEIHRMAEANKAFAHYKV